MQLEPITRVLVFDVVNTTTIQGLGIRPTYSFASLLLSILTLLLLSSGCPVVSCDVLRYLDRPNAIVVIVDVTTV